MRRSTTYLYLLLGAFAVLRAAFASAANGDILERTAIATGADATFVAERVVYESDGLRIVGFLAYPKGASEGAARLPCVLFNRGGNRDFGAITPESFLNRARRITPWGYVLFASNYRGSPGSEGMDEFGGSDVNDVHNAIRVFDKLAFADRDRIGMWGHSRGGMMTYIALTTTDRIRAAVIGAGSADLERWISLRPEMDTEVAAQIVPNWKTERARAIEARSAVRFVDRMPANVPILLVHGTADWRVDPRDSMDMASALFAAKKPFSLLLIEGADHAITERRDEYYHAARVWLDRYVRDRGKLPVLTPHGT
jgi:dipeptidyl aminopeptidase/acylaminoacyl peptidase